MISNFDWTLLLAALLLSALSVLFVHSAMVSHRVGAHYWEKQLLWLIGGLVALGLTLCFDYHTYSDYSAVFYFLSILSLIYVLIFGKTINNTKGWADFGAFHIQPAEFAKIVVLIALARYFSTDDKEHLELTELIIGGGIVLVPFSLVLLQKDTGTALSFLPIFVVLALCGGARRKVIITMVVVMVLVAPLVWFSLKDYHRERIKSMLDPEYDIKGIGYQSAQSKIAIGSGKVLGKGINQGSQSRLGFLPGRHTDFIYAVVGEETGFVGAGAVLLLYLFIFLRLANIAKEAKERFGSMIVLGVLSILLFHVIINIGMVLGLMPIIGIPLPFLSYGGSSLISNFLALGLVLNVGMRKYVN